MIKKILRWEFFWLALVCLIPLFDRFLPQDLKFAKDMPRIFIFAILALGLNVVVGFTGLLHLGIAAFMAIGAYAYAILTVNIYPFQIGFWPAALAAMVITAIAGILLGGPTLRLRGDYLAIVTLGFGEIMRDVLKNLIPITKGTQTLNPLPRPAIGDLLVEYPSTLLYYVFLALMVIIVIVSRNLEKSKIGRVWVAIREDELASSCMGINTSRAKLTAFAIGAAIAGLAGVMYASFLTTSGDPGRYDFNISITALCIVIIGGIGNIYGVLVGAALLMSFDTIFINKLTDFLQKKGVESGTNVFLQPVNWQWLIFGLALVLMMRYRREGILPSIRAKAELTKEE